MEIDYDIRLTVTLPDSVDAWNALQVLVETVEAKLGQLPGRMKLDAYDATDDDNDVTIEAPTLREVREELRFHGLAADSLSATLWLYRKDATAMITLTTWLGSRYARSLEIEISSEEKLDVLAIHSELKRRIGELQRRRKTWAEVTFESTALTQTTRHRILGSKTREVGAQLKPPAVAPIPIPVPLAVPQPTATPEARTHAPSAIAVSKRSHGARLYESARPHVPAVAIGLIVTIGGGLIVGFLLFLFRWI